MAQSCLIRQPAGLGDVLFCQKIAKTLISQGYTVHWPVLPQLQYIRDYIRYPGLSYESPRCDKELCLDSADRIYPGCVIRAKYALAGIEWQDWADYLVFKRNADRENELFQKLGCGGEPYAFVNRNYGTPPNYARKNFQFSTSLRLIESGFVDNYNPFDWCKVLENAAEIYTVDTSFMILMEKLDLQSRQNKVWGRSGHFTHVEGLFKQKWDYITTT